MAYPQTMTYAIETKHLTVKRGDRTILSDIHVQIEEGEFVAIIGRSGEGKSTLLHTLAGHLPYSGSISIPQKIGIIFQQYTLFPWMTASQNIAFGLQMEKIAKKAWVHECLEMAGLIHKAHAYPGELSGGQQQRIAIARAFAHTPDVLLMDEPFCSLDAITKQEMQIWLLRIQKEHRTTIILVTHDLREAQVLANRVLAMEQGKLEKVEENTN